MSIHNQSRLQNTALYMGPVRVRKEVLYDDIACDHPSSEQTVVVAQQDLIDDFLGRLQRKQMLGRGGFGTAYLCIYQEPNTHVTIPVVAKFPNEVDVVDSSNRKQGKLDNVLAEFQQEALNAQLLLEGEMACSLFPAGQPMHASAEELGTIRAELKRMKAQPGYQRIHRLLHLVTFPYPVLISEPCDGSLQNAVNANAAGQGQWPNLLFTIYGLPNAWPVICKQICDGINYMHYMKLGHLDMKPDNVLYRINPKTAEIQCYISDFGGCVSPATEQVGAPVSISYTPYFFDEQAMHTQFTPQYADWYSTAATLLALLVVQSNVNQNISYDNPYESIQKWSAVLQCKEKTLLLHKSVELQILRA